jgi:hypothetical protein
MDCIRDCLKLEQDIIKLALQRAKHEGLDKNQRLKPGGDYHGKLEEFCMFKMAYYSCYKCKKPYFGGMKDCEAG